MGIVNAIRRWALPPQSAAVMLVAAVAACAPQPQPFADLPRLGVVTQITTKNMCGLGVSPRITVRNAPPATARYTVRMTNVDVLFGQPWQITADAQPGGIAEGALPDFPAPCVGALEVYSQLPYHMHRFEVLALDQQGAPLAYGQTTVPVYGIDRALEYERAAAAGRQPVREGQPQMTPLTRPVPPPFIDPALVPMAPEGLYQR